MITLRPHQEEAVAAIVRHFGDPSATRGQVIMACGTGKTFVAAAAAKELSARRIVFLAPSIHVAAQAADAWREAGLHARAVVCSRLESKVAAGVPVTTDEGRLADLIRDRAEWVVFGTYASSRRIGEALRQSATTADLVVFDEAHRVAGAEGKAWAAALWDSCLPAARRLFLTATPRVNADAEDDLCGMEDADTFGPVIHNLPLPDAILRGLVADYRLTCAEVPEGVDVSTPLLQEAAIHAAVAREVALGGIRTAFMFRHTIARCEISRGLLAKLGVNAAVVSGKQSIRERREIVDRLVRDGGIAITDQALAEGVDVPDVDAVIFMDSKTSVIYIAQAIGRALRNGGNLSKIAQIVTPSVASGAGFVETVGTLKHVIEALEAHDERLEEAIRHSHHAAVAGLGPPHPTVSWLDEHGLTQALSGRVGEAVLRDLYADPDAAFQQWIRALEDFVAANGHARVPLRHVTANGMRLGRWVVNQRQTLRDPARRRRIEAVPGWTWSVLDATFMNNLARWERFVADHGTRPRRRAQPLSPDEAELAGWARQVKADTPERAAELESAGVLNRPATMVAKFRDAVIADPGRVAGHYLAVMGGDASLPSRAALAGVVRRDGPKNRFRYYPSDDRTPCSGGSE